MTANRRRSRLPRGLLLFAVGTLLLSCSTRDALNPLDPRNPETGGDPQWLEVLADSSAVDLAWEVPAFVDLEEVRILDLTAGEVLWTGKAGSGSLRQAPVPNGVERNYRIELGITGLEPRALPVAAAEPGLAVPWVLDDGSGRAVRLTPDAREARNRVTAPQAGSLRAEPDSGAVLVLDFFAGRVRLLDREGRERWRNESFERPLATLPVAGGWWIADPGAGTVSLLDGAGSLVFADSTFEFPVDLAPGDGETIWVSDNDRTVARVSRDGGVILRIPGFGVPDALAPAPAGGVWVSDVERDELVRLDAAGAVVRRLEGLPSVVGLTADPVLPGGIWVSERATGAVRLLDGEGVQVGILTDMESPSMCVVAPDGSSVWVADSGGGAILVFSREGNLLRRSRGLSVPVSISVAFSPR